jgi:uncharacterized cofD-like protein
VNVVGIGGGHGLARALAAVQLLGERPTAVVTVADDGGSSGRLREEHGIVALGDMRMALHTLASNAALAPVFQHRFGAGELKDHALGNLLLLALIEMHDGDLVAAVDAAADLLQCGGRVLPATTEGVQLCGRVGGRTVGGQVQVATAGPVERVWLTPEAPEACEEAVDAITRADLVILGPGSLFTSILATLLVPRIGQAVTQAAGHVLLVANLSTQPGETADFDTAAHIDALVSHVPGLRLDTVLLHNGPLVTGPGEPITALESHPLAGRIVGADLALRSPDGTVTGIHDPQRLAAAIGPLLGG